MKHLTRSSRKLIKAGVSLFLLLLMLVSNFAAPVAVNAAGESQAAGSPWPMYRHDPQHTGRSSFVGPQTNAVAWIYQTGGAINSSPAVGSDGKIYVGSEDGKLYAVASDGSEVWEFTTGGNVYSSPALAEDGTIYVGSEDHNLYAIHPDGTLDWTFPTGGEVYSSPVIWTDGTIYVGSYDGNLYGINPDGTQKCSYFAGAGIQSSPAIGPDGFIYVGVGDGRMISLNLDCTLRWIYILESHHGVWSSPALSPSGDTVYFGADDGYFWAVDTATGIFKWQSPYTYGGVQGSAAIGTDGTVYVGTQFGHLWALDPATGVPNWDYYMAGEVVSSPAIGADGTIYFSVAYGTVFAMNPAGTVKWTYGGGYDFAGHFRYSSPAIGSNGALYVGSNNGKLFAFNSTSLIATSDHSEVYPGDALPVNLTIRGANNLYAVQSTCLVDPAVLQPQSAVFGDFFDPTLRLVAANQVDAAAGRWLGAISQQNPASPLSGNGLFATISYVATAPGVTHLTCEPIFSDRNGFALPVAFVGLDITVLPFAIIDGVVTYQGRTNHTGIGITATGTVTLTATTDTVGNFSLAQLKTGAYDVKADAALYLPACANDVAMTSGHTVTLATVALLGGDLNSDEMINIGDVSRLGSGFNTSDPGADINADGTVNVQDLAIVGGNYEVSGCQGW